MRLSTLVERSRQITETTKRLEKIELLAGLLGQLQPEEVEITVAFLSGRILQRKLGIGYAAFRELPTSTVEAPLIEIKDVDRTLESIASTAGPGSEGRRRELLRTLLSQATPVEQQFLIRLMLGELRQGALEGIMLEAIAKASRLPTDLVRRAVMMAGDIVPVARAALEKGEAGLAQYQVQLFRPVQPMLAQPAEDVADALQNLGEMALEYKIDGARIQVHRSGDEVAVYSRRLNNVTAAVPEIVEAVRALPAKDFILDGEVISLDEQGRPRSFQTTMRRFGRKLEVDRMRQELPLAPFWFDLIYLDGGSLLDESQIRRFASLGELVPPATLIPHTVTADQTHAEDFLHEALQHGHEGIMAKAVTAGYAAGARGRSWLKIKQARTLDLAILAAEWGNGRRQGWLSNLHLGARDIKNGGFAMLGKTFKGLTDEMLKWQTEELLKLELMRDAYTVYVEPKLVAEITFNEIQISSRYASGLALRFARVERYRPDKSIDQVDTLETVQKLAGVMP